MNERESMEFLLEHPELQISDEAIAALEAEFDAERAEGREIAALARGERVISPGDVAELNPESLRAAVDHLCFECVCRAANWRSEVRACENESCRLWPIRPGASK